MRPLLLLLSLLLIHSTVYADDVLKSVKEYDDMWRGFRDSEDDPLTKLIEISNNLKSFLSLGRSIGGLIEEATEPGWNPRPDQIEAMSVLNVNISRHFQYSEREENHKKEWLFEAPFARNILLPLDKIESVYEMVTYTMPGEYYQKTFKEKCQEIANFDILTELKQMYSQNVCELPSLDSQTRYIRVMEAIQNSEYFFTPRDDYYERDWQKAVEALTQTIHKCSDNELKNMITQLNQAKSSSRGVAIDKIKGIEPVKIHNDEKHLGQLQFIDCRLAVVFDSNFHKRDVVLAALAQFTVELRGILILTSACSNISFRGYPNAVANFEDKSFGKVKEIIEFTIRWTKNALQSDWPSGPANRAKAELRNRFGPLVAKENYNAAATLTRTLFEEHGFEDFDYNILVTLPLKNNTDYCALSLSADDHSVIPTDLGIDIHVFRYNSSQIANVMENVRWRLNNTVKIEEILKTLPDVMPYAPPAEKLEYVLKASGEASFTRPNFYGHVAMFAMWSFSKEEAQLPIGEALGDSGGRIDKYQYFFGRRDFNHKMFFMP